MKETAYLIIHGFAGGLFDIQHLADYLQKKGLDVYTVRLAGHESSKIELKKTSHGDWYYSVEEKITELQKEYDNIVLIGFSMGGLLSIRFANIGRVRKLVLVNTPVYVMNIFLILKKLLKYFKNHEEIKEYKENKGKASLKSCVDFLRMLSMTKKVIQDVKMPVLIVQCRADLTVHYKSAKYLQRKIGETAEIRFYEGGCHEVFRRAPEIRDDVCHDIYDYLA